MLTLGEIFTIFLDTLAGHAGLAVYLFAIMDERRWRQLKKLPALLLSPIAATCVGVFCFWFTDTSPTFLYILNSGTILLMCTL